MKRRYVLGFTGVLALLIVVSLASTDELWIDGDDPTVTTTTTTTVPLSTTVPQDAPYATLAKVLPERLDGYRVDTGAKATGSLDLEAAVAAESDKPAERALLETRHFESGYARSFTNGETDVYMAVYDFEGAEDARLYAEDGVINLTGKGASIYEIAEIPGARGFSQGTNADGRPAVVHGVAFAKADRVVLTFTRSASTSAPTQAKEIAAVLYERT